MGPMWVNLYGAPQHIAFSVKNATTSAVQSLSRTAHLEIDYKHQYNTLPDKASCYKGRVLISQRIKEEAPKSISKKIADAHESFRRKIHVHAAAPPTTTYVLRAIIVSGSQLPQITKIASKNAGKTHKLFVKVSIGRQEMCTEKKENIRGVCDWHQELFFEEMDWPIDQDQIPDIFVYLMKGKGANQLPICFKRFKAKDLIAGKMDNPAEWILLKEDKVINALSENVFPGSLLLKLGFGSVYDANRTLSDWISALSKLRNQLYFQLRVHIYQVSSLN